MAFFLNAIQAGILLLLPYIFWRLLQPFVVKTSLSDIPGPPRDSWWKGNFYQIWDLHGWKFHHDIVEKYGGVVKLFGLFGAEMLYVTDPRALHEILLNQDTYEATEWELAATGVFFGPNLVSTLGEQHRHQRKMLNPLFSSKHMRDLITVFYPIAHELRDLLVRKVKSGEDEINVVKWMTRAALEYIGQGGLGYTFDSLDNEGKTDAYLDAVKIIGPVSSGVKLTRQYMPYLLSIGTPAFRRKVAEWMPVKRFQDAKRIIDLMDANSRVIYAKKKEAFMRGDEEIVKQVGRGKDIMSILLQANMAADAQDRLSEEELIGQMSLFIFAGHNTTASAICRALHMFTIHTDVQDKLREEVTRARKEFGDLDYDKLMGLPYLDAVCKETLRLFPPACFRIRTTRSDVVIPLYTPIKSVDGKKEISEIHAKKNTDVIVSIIGSNQSKEVWGEDAEEWKPERWLVPLPESVAASRLPGVYASMMTFIGGGRACIGFKFAELEMKVALSTLLETFVFSLEKEVYWNMGDIAMPVLKDSKDVTPQLPLKLALVDNWS